MCLGPGKFHISLHVDQKHDLKFKKARPHTKTLCNTKQYHLIKLKVKIDTYQIK